MLQSVLVKNMGNIKNRRAVSPVIATVILVAVAITIAVAVAYWMGGISSQYTRFEKIEVTSAYCESGNTTASTQYWGATEDLYWEITLDFRNTGTTEAAIINAFVNSKAVADYGEDAGTTDYMLAYDTAASATAGDELDFDADEKVVVKPGEKAKLVLLIKQEGDTAYAFTSGTTIEVAIHSGAGNAYMKMVTLT